MLIPAYTENQITMRIILAILFVAYRLIKHDRLRHVVFFPVKLLFGCIGIMGIIVLLEIMLATFGW